MNSKVNFKNLTQLKKYLKENEGKVYYKFVHSNGISSLRRCFKVQTNCLISLNNENAISYFEWNKSDNYTFNNTGFVFKDTYSGLIFDMNITDEEIAEFEKSLQYNIEQNKVREKIRKHEELQRQIEAKNTENQRIQEKIKLFMSCEKISTEDFLKLCDLYHVKMHIRTKGYFKNSVDSVWIDSKNNAVYSYRAGTNSSLAYLAILNLRDSILSKSWTASPYISD